MALALELGSAPKVIIPVLKDRKEQGRGWQERPHGRGAESTQVEVTVQAEAKRQFAG